MKVIDPIFFTIRRLGILHILIVGGIAAVTVLACGWSFTTEHSVRFNSYRTGRGFYRLPPLPIMYDRKTGKELTQAEWYEEGEYEAPTSNSADLWEAAKIAIENDDLKKAQTSLNNFVTLTAQPSLDDAVEIQEQRNSAIDMLDALAALDHGSNMSSVKAYLNARSDLNSNLLHDHLNRAPVDRNLDDNWMYLTAAMHWKQNEKELAAEIFRKLAAKYPNSEKAEAALYMNARFTMESSSAFDDWTCVEGETKSAESPKPPVGPYCKDESWKKALTEFQQLMRKYPNGPYFNDARGWIAYLYRHGGERAKALAEYYRMLGDRHDRSARLEAKKSLQMMDHEADDATLDEVEKLIAGDVDASMAYAYHRIYNYAVDRTYQRVEPWYSDYSSMSERKIEVDVENKAGNHELSRVANFASAMLKRYPGANASGGFVVRLAEAELELQNYKDALKDADKALSLGIQGDLRAQALWIKGSSEHETKRFKAARSTFNQLITEFPNDKLTEGARRLLALVAEDEDDLETALEQYLALDYKYDVIYYVDVLLPTDRLAKFVATHTTLPQYDQLLYSLGVRYMRDERWDDARNTLRRVRTKDIQWVTCSYGYDERERETPFIKSPDCSDRSDRVLEPIRSSWLMQDLKTIDTLDHLERNVEAANSEETRAEAMYQLASFQYDSDSLLFYNPTWEGYRAELLAGLASGGNIRLPNESQLIFEHSQQHEPLAQAIPIYQEIVENWPQTGAAKDALFSAAVAHERLADLNTYWRDMYGRGFFVGTKRWDFADISRLYPRFRWPKSRLGWEASTRTVNGGPAYDPLPKPAPKLTRIERAERALKRVAVDSSAKIKNNFTSTVTTGGAMLTASFYYLLAAVTLMVFGYAGFMRVHLRRANSMRAQQTVEQGSSLETLPDSESRMAKLIDDN